MPQQDIEAEDEPVEKIIVIPPDGGWGWVVVCASFICILVIDGIPSTYGLVMGELKDHFNASESQVSLANSLLNGFYFVMGPFSGALANRFGFRFVCILGGCLSTVSIVIAATSTSVHALQFFYGVSCGFGFSLIYIAAVLSVGFYFERWRALATCIALCGSGVGTFIMAPVVNLIHSHYSWKFVFYFNACCTVACAIFGLCFKPITPSRVDEYTSTTTIGLIRRGQSLHNAKYPTAAEALETEEQTRGGPMKGILKPPVGPSGTQNVSSPKVKGARNKDRDAGVEENGGRSRMKAESVGGKGKEPRENRRSQGGGVEKKKDRKQMVVVGGVVGGLVEEDPQDCYCCCCIPCCRCCLKTRCGKCCRCRGCGIRYKQTKIGARPLYRDDIFYDGSKLVLRQLSQLPNEPVDNALRTVSLDPSVQFVLSMSRLPTRRDVEEERDTEFRCCPESFTRVMKTMMDVKLFKMPEFFFFVASSSILQLGAYTPLYYLVDRGVLTGLSLPEASFLLSVTGITNMVSRVICGIVVTLPCVNAFVFQMAVLLFGAALSSSKKFLDSSSGIYTYSGLYGIVFAAMGSLRSVLLVSLVGLEKLTNAFGLLLLILGIFTTAGPPIVGLLNVFDNIHAPFYFTSASALAAGILLIPVVIFHRRTLKKKFQLNH